MVVSKTIATVVAIAVVLSIASAQEYSIRANAGLNLRAAPSLNADIADQVRAGAVLQVVGKFNRWLKINRAGREVWLADWVDFSRVDSAGQTGSQQPTAPIDNCCYVDRQCHSDLDWIGGWHAFQNGQCAAPARPQPATPAQPVASAPANVDNCCYVDRHCQSELDWIGGWHAYRAGRCARFRAGRFQLAGNRRQLLRIRLGMPNRSGKGAGILDLSDQSVRRPPAVFRDHAYGTSAQDRGFRSICAAHHSDAEVHEERSAGLVQLRDNRIGLNR